LRDLGLRYGQGYYMARPGPPFVSLRDDIRAELRNLIPNVRPSAMVPNDDEEDEDRELAIPRASSTDVRHQQVFGTGSQNAIPRNVFGRPDDEITNDFKLPPEAEQRRPRASEPPIGADITQPLPPWKPLVDDEGTNPGEPLITALRKPENTPDDERGPGRPGLN